MYQEAELSPSQELRSAYFLGSGCANASIFIFFHLNFLHLKVIPWLSFGSLGIFRWKCPSVRHDLICPNSMASRFLLLSSSLGDFTATSGAGDANLL